MTSQQSWRVLLDHLIADPLERRRLANALGINPVTLVRWANGESSPRMQSVSALLRHIPSQYQAQMVGLVTQEYPDVTLRDPSESGDEEGRIPSVFYASVIDALTKTPESQRFFTISHRVFSQALDQLDPNNLGMALSLALCMHPASGQYVRSLREVAGRGTPPWQSTLTQEALFLGVESLAGYALTKGRTYVAENKDDRMGFYAVRWEEWEESATACPVMLEGRYAGCLIASSTQPGYFLPFRQALLEQYAGLMALALDAKDFYNHEDIKLLPMPARDVQHERTASFRQRLSQIILDASRNHEELDIEQAERLVWQQLEEELLSGAVQSTPLP